MNTWKDYYQNEEQLINDLMKINIEEYKKRYCKGFVYIESFQKYYNKNQTLTPKQLTQLKRLAGEIYKYHHWEW